MAKSPEKNASSSEVIRYDRGWDAINAMLRAGRSLSGHERNCCFLNSRGERFADVSSVLGLDFADDGRVLALADWDYDGDIDFWIANRSGPQLRFLENRVAQSERFVAIRLEGVNCNRDAIGAKLTLDCVLQGKPSQQTATLKAGEGYLSQNSKWIHFGLGRDGEAKQLTIRWPHGVEQKLSVQPNKFYRVREGEAAVQWQPPTQEFRRLEAKPFDAEPVSDAARIVLLNPLPIPRTEALDSSSDEKKPRLINLWATWCEPCLEELAEWKHHAEEFEQLGVEIVAMNVDEPKEGRESLVDQVWQKLGLPFRLELGDQETAEHFDLLQRSLLSRQRPLPVPSSFLVDGEGRLCVLYKGPVDAETLLADAKLVGAAPQQILDAAVPFAGRWNSPPGGSTPLNLAVKYLEGGLVDEGAGYIESLLEQKSTHPEYVTSSILNLYAATMLDRKEFRKAEVAFRESLSLDPSNRQAHIELGTILLRSKRGREAVSHFETVLESNATDPELTFKLGMAHLEGGNIEAAKSSLERSVALRPNPSAYWQLANLALQTPSSSNVASAVELYEQAIQLNPALASKANNLAWILATHSDDSIRNGQRALELAKAICEQPSVNDPSSVDTLAAAFASVGDYENAASAATRAIEEAKRAGNDGLAQRIAKRLSLYQKREPYRESF